MLDTIKSFFRERLDFAKSKGVLKIQIVLDPGRDFFSVVLLNIALWPSGEFQNCINLICLCYPGLPEFFFLPVSMGHLKFTERDITGAAVSSIDF